MTIEQLQRRAYDNSKSKGFHDEPMNVGEKLMLIVSEASEALEAHRSDHFAQVNKFSREYDKLEDPTDEEINELFEKYIKNSFEDELADIVIRVGDLAEALKINLTNHISAKMSYNSKRPHMHGKKY